MAVDYFLKIEGIEGESEDSEHKGEIELGSFNWEEAQQGSFSQGGGGGSGKVKMGNFDFIARTSKASPKLMLACATGQHIPSATLNCRKAGGGQQDFYTVTFSDVLVAKYHVGSGDGNGVHEEEVAAGGYDEGVLTDEVSLNFGKIEVEYKPQKPDGSLDSPVKVGYNLKQNKKV